MPWPLLPPNPDTKTASYDDEIFVFNLTLTGMSPHIEQLDHTFTVNGVNGAVWVPVETSSTLYKFTGVGMAPLSTVGSSATLKCTYVPAGLTKSHTIDINTASLAGSVSNLTSATSGSDVVIKADYNVPSGSWFLVAAPYETTMPQYSNLASYQAAGNYVSVSGSGRASVTVTPGGVSQYVVFVAEGLPDEFLPGSAGELITI